MQAQAAAAQMALAAAALGGTHGVAPPPAAAPNPRPWDGRPWKGVGKGAVEVPKDAPRGGCALLKAHRGPGKPWKGSEAGSALSCGSFGGLPPTAELLAAASAVAAEDASGFGSTVRTCRRPCKQTLHLAECASMAVSVLP